MESQRNNNPRTLKSRTFFVIGSFLILLVLSSEFIVRRANVANAASAPSIITYQGKVLVNNLAATTTLPMKFVLFDSASGGTALYTAAGTLPATSTINVAPVNGLFSINLGDVGTNSLDPAIFQNNQTVYLEVTINGETLSPRKQITASPYSYNSKYLDGYSASTTAVTTTNYIPVSDSGGNFDFNSITSTALNISTVGTRPQVNLNSRDGGYGGAINFALGGVGSFSLYQYNGVGKLALYDSVYTQQDALTLYSGLFEFNRPLSINGITSSTVGVDASLRINTTNGVSPLKVYDTGSNIRFFVSSTGQIGINTTTVSGNTLTVNALNSASRGLVVSGLAGQSANLAEFRNSAGTALAYISQTGGAYFTGTSTFATTTIASSTITSANITSLNVVNGNYDGLTWNNATGTNTILTNATTTNLVISGSIFNSGALLTFTGAQTFDATKHQIGRNTTVPVNALQFNIPTGGEFVWSENGVQKMKLAGPTGHLQVGSSSLMYNLGLIEAQKSITLTSGFDSVVYSGFSLASESNSSANVNGLSFYGLVNTPKTYSGILSGVVGQITAQGGSGTSVAEANGLYGIVSNTTNSTTTLAIGARGRIGIASGLIGTGIGLYSGPFGSTGGTITNSYGLKIDAPGIGTNQWTAGFGTGNSYFEGNLVVGSSTAPSYTLDVRGTLGVTGTSTMATTTISSSTINTANINALTFTNATGTSLVLRQISSGAVSINVANTDSLLTINVSSDSAASFIGNSSQVTTDGLGAVNLNGFVIGNYSDVIMSGSGTGVAVAAGTYSRVTLSSTPVGIAAGVLGTVDLEGIATTTIGVWASGSRSPYVVNAYGLKVDSPLNATNNWTMGVGTGNSYIEGSLNIGASTTPSYTLDVQGAFGVSATGTLLGRVLIGTSTAPVIPYQVFIDSGASTTAGLGVNGYVKASGYITGSTTLDLAETYPIDPACVDSNSCPEPGDTVCLANNNGTIEQWNNATIEKCATPYSSNAIGIVSTNPGFTLGDPFSGNVRKVALAGRVPLKVSTQNGPIKIGDRLTSSDIPGVAVKATSDGLSIGIALEDFTDENLKSQACTERSECIENQKSTITAFVNISWWLPSLTDVASSTPSTESTSLFSRILNWFKNIGIIIENGFIRVKRLVVDDQFCINSTCVNEDQLKQILNNNQLQPAAPATVTEPTASTPALVPTGATPSAVEGSVVEGPTDTTTSSSTIDTAPASADVVTGPTSDTTTTPPATDTASASSGTATTPTSDSAPSIAITPDTSATAADSSATSDPSPEPIPATDPAPAADSPPPADTTTASP